MSASAGDCACAFPLPEALGTSTTTREMVLPATRIGSIGRGVGEVPATAAGASPDPSTAIMSSIGVAMARPPVVKLSP